MPLALAYSIGPFAKPAGVIMVIDARYYGAVPDVQGASGIAPRGANGNEVAYANQLGPQYVSYWKNIEAMSQLTGGDPTRIHHLPRDPEFLIELPKHVQILHLRTSHGDTEHKLTLPGDRNSLQVFVPETLAPTS